MQTVGVICEYNPFHLGHARQLELLRQKLGDLAALMKTAREQLMMTTLLSPVMLLADMYKSESAAALPWFGLAVVYYLLFELLWRRYKKQVDQVMAEV